MKRAVARRFQACCSTIRPELARMEANLGLRRPTSGAGVL
jgi:hypothetical protein